MKTLTQVVDCLIITRRGGNWLPTVNDKSSGHYHFGINREKLITSRDDYADWIFYQVWENHEPGLRSVIKVADGKLLQIPFTKWDPHGGFNRDGGSYVRGHNIFFPISERDWFNAYEHRPTTVTPPDKETILVQLLSELSTMRL